MLGRTASLARSRLRGRIGESGSVAELNEAEDEVIGLTLDDAARFGTGRRAQGRGRIDQEDTVDLAPPLTVTLEFPFVDVGVDEGAVRVDEEHRQEVGAEAALIMHRDGDRSLVVLQVLIHDRQSTTGIRATAVAWLCSGQQTQVPSSAMPLRSASAFSIDVTMFCQVMQPLPALSVRARAASSRSRSACAACPTATPVCVWSIGSNGFCDPSRRHSRVFSFTGPTLSI